MTAIKTLRLHICNNNLINGGDDREGRDDQHLDRVVEGCGVQEAEDHGDEEAPEAVRVAVVARGEVVVGVGGDEGRGVEEDCAYFICSSFFSPFMGL